MFYYLFGWEMRHLHTGGSCPVVSGQGCVIMTSFGPSLSAEAMPNFLFCYVTSRSTYIIYIYIIIKLYNNTTIFAPDPAGGLTAPPIPPAGKDCASRKKCHLFFFPQ